MRHNNFNFPSYEDENPTSYFGSASPEDEQRRRRAIADADVPFAQPVALLSPCSPDDVEPPTMNLGEEVEEGKEDEEEEDEPSPRNWVPPFPTAVSTQLEEKLEEKVKEQQQQSEAKQTRKEEEEEEEIKRKEDDESPPPLDPVFLSRSSNVTTSRALNFAAPMEEKTKKALPMEEKKKIEKRDAQVSADLLPSSCVSCERIKSLFTVSEESDFESLQNQWKQLSTVFNRFENTCQQILFRANEIKDQQEEQNEEGRTLTLVSDIRSGQFDLVQSKKQEVEEEQKFFGAIASMRERATRSSRNASAATSLNNSRASSVDREEEEEVVEQKNESATKQRSALSPLHQRQQQQQTGGGGGNPLHFVALRKCLKKEVKREDF